ncbi:MAG: hypothetical protein EXR99_08880 [Gemmataceae bacterium]|nr:hypothetical protein [Gemmataceae bacterium]
MASEIAPVAPMKPAQQQITVYSHSALFYWWPVWLIGFILAILTLIDHHLLAVVPSSAQAFTNVTGPGGEKGEGIIVLKKAGNEILPRDDNGNQPAQPRLYVARSKNYGVTFTIAILLIIFITNVPLRGMWSVLVVVLIITGVTILVLAGYWERILITFHMLDIRINLGGYLFLSTGLLLIWLIAFFYFDRQVYITFTPGQIRVQTEVGDGEKVYDAFGMTLEKQRSDFFRHWILGMSFFGIGTGDLVIRTAGAQNHIFDLPNVIGVEGKIRAIEQLLQTKEVNIN